MFARGEVSERDLEVIMGEKVGGGLGFGRG